jgi:hypothetical protein
MRLRLTDCLSYIQLRDIAGWGHGDVWTSSLEGRESA